MRPHLITLISVLTLLAIMPIGTAALAEDCNGNGIPDELDVQPTLDFGVAVNYIAGILPSDQAVGDLNGDGFDDFVTSTSSDAVAVVLSRGDGTYAFPATYTIDDRATGIALGDLEGDDDLDIFAASHNSNSVTILTNNGISSGVFSWTGTMTVLLSPGLATVAAVNLDADGDTDLALVFDDRVLIRLNDGSGNFTGSDQFMVGTEVVAVLATDLDDDLDADLILADRGADNMSVLENNGNATFQPVVHYPVGDAPEGLGVGFLDTDTNPDIAVANRGSDNITVLFGNADATFGAMQTIAVGDDPTGVATGDFDDDNDTDLAVCNRRDHTVKVLWNDGSGNFPASSTHPTGRYPTAVNAVDVDLDGDADLAALCQNVTITVLENDGAGNFPLGPGVVIVTQNGAFDVLGADLDGDEQPDLAIVNWVEDIVTVLRNDGPFFSFVGDFTVGEGPFSITCGDFDGVNGTDLATANVDAGTVSVLLNDGSANYAPAVSYPINTEAVGVVAAYLDSDAHLDLAVTYPGVYDSGSGTYSTGYVYVLLNDGNGAFITSGTYPSGEGAGGIEAGDFNGDLVTDLAVSNLTSGDISVHINNGDGTFAPVARYPFDVTLYDITVGDFNNDSFDDIAAARYDIMNLIDDGLGVFMNNGDGTFGPVQIYNAGGATLKLTNGDLDADGDRDLVLGNAGTDDVVVLPNRGEGTFGNAVNWLGCSGVTGVALADVNADEKTDIVAAGLNEGEVVILHNDFAPPYSSDRNGNFVPDECETLGDLNCDDALDGFDIDAFVLVLLTVEPYTEYYAQYPDCDHMRADINGDGAIDGFDIDQFVDLLLG